MRSRRIITSRIIKIENEISEVKFRAVLASRKGSPESPYPSESLTIKNPDATVIIERIRRWGAIVFKVVSRAEFALPGGVLSSFK